jgi:hypothetical protein
MEQTLIARIFIDRLLFISPRGMVIRMEQISIARLNMETLLFITPAKTANLRPACVLIDHGADLSIKNNKGRTAFDVAKTKGLGKDLAHKVQDKQKVLIQENKQQKLGNHASPG